MKNTQAEAKKLTVFRRFIMHYFNTHGHYPGYDTVCEELNEEEPSEETKELIMEALKTPDVG